jgi:hypothetical protein
MFHVKNAMRLPIPDDCCGTARRLIAEGLDGSVVLEFCRGDTVCLRGRADAFAKLTVRETITEGPKHVLWKPRPAFWKSGGADAGEDRNEFQEPEVG